MLDTVLAFLGSLLNLFISIIYKIGLTMLLLFLVVMAIGTSFIVTIVWLLQ